MNNYNSALVKEIFSRLFVMAIDNKINLSSFTTMLIKSDFINHIENNQYIDIGYKSIVDMFYEITNFKVKEDNTFGVFNDAYWCGNAYFYLFSVTKKPFSYIFLKFPLQKMIDLYPLFHEMDWSELLEMFKKTEKEKTIFRLLCETCRYSIPKISELLKINVNTLRSYIKSDDKLYGASFKNIFHIARFFDVPVNLFIEKLD